MDIAPVVLRADAVSKSFGGVAAVDNVSLDVRANEFLVLLGASGCGKTTLLRLFAGFETPDAGRIFIAGADMTAVPPHRRPVNMMFQSYALFPHMSVADNVAFGLKQEGVTGADLAARVNEVLATVELQGLGERRPHQLSGGQRQRVALARCLAKRPKVLLLDEPMAALDKHLRERTQLELMALRAQLGISFVVVTHDQDEAMIMADRVAVMEVGGILQVGAPRDLYEHPASQAVARFFGDINLWEGVIAADRRGITCALLRHTFTSAAPLPPAQTKVMIAIRPEQIAFDDHGLAGVIADVVYRGTVTTYFVRVGEHTIRIVRQNVGSHMPRHGETVHLAFAPTGVRVLPP